MQIGGVVIIDFSEVDQQKLAQRFSEIVEAQEKFGIRARVALGSEPANSLERYFGVDFRKNPDHCFDDVRWFAEYFTMVDEEANHVSWVVRIYRSKGKEIPQRFLIMEFHERVVGAQPLGVHDMLDWWTVPWALAHANRTITIGRTNVRVYAREVQTFQQLLSAFNRMCGPIGLLKKRIDTSTGRGEGVIQPFEAMQFRLQVANLVFNGFEDTSVWPEGICFFQLTQRLQK